jgi:hypothetical protein
MRRRRYGRKSVVFRLPAEIVIIWLPETEDSHRFPALGCAINERPHSEGQHRHVFSTKTQLRANPAARGGSSGSGESRKP